MTSKVLVVDDDPLTCELIHEVLSSAEIEARGVTDSREAANHLQHEKFDAAFLDARMPDPDGIELTRQIRASSLNKSTLVVMITGDEEQRFLTRAFEVGVNFVLFKPVDRHALLRLLRVTKGPMERERQRFARVNAGCRVAMACGQDQARGMTSYVSMSGMLVQANRVFALGSLVQLNLEVGKGKPTIRGTARVTRQVGLDSMELEFHNLSSAENGRLQEFLAASTLHEAGGVPTAAS
jgi:CheY-like chemotaxis protein